MPLFNHFDPDEDSLFYQRFCNGTDAYRYLKPNHSDEECTAIRELFEAELAGKLPPTPFELWSNRGRERHFFTFHPGSNPLRHTILFAVFRKASREEIAEWRRKATEY